MFVDYYKILGIKISATSEEIKRAYRLLAKEHHPDINSSAKAHESFLRINEAYQVLSDPDKKYTYDLKYKYSVEIGFSEPVKRKDRKYHYSAGAKKEADFHYDWQSFNTSTHTKDLRDSHPFLYHALFIFGMFVGFLIILLFALSVYYGFLNFLFLLGIIPGVILVIEGFNGILGRPTRYQKIIRWFINR